MAVELGLVEAVAVGVEGADLAGCRVAGEVDVAAAALPLAPREPHVGAESPRRKAEARDGSINAGKVFVILAPIGCAAVLHAGSLIRDITIL